MTTTTTTTAPDWTELLRTWDRQQEGYVPDREQLVATMLDVIERVVGTAPRVLDLACGPGSLSVRVLDRFPQATAVAVDIDPVLLAIGRGALGDHGGRLQWVEADLRDSRWVDAVGGEPFDVVLSATALHWLTPAQLASTYQSLGRVVRTGGVFLNADRLDFDHSSAVSRELAANLTQRQWEAAFDAADRQDWQSWWDTVAEDPSMHELLERRQARFDDERYEKKEPGSLSSLSLHRGCLLNVGFAEVETIWQDLNRRLLLAVR